MKPLFDRILVEIVVVEEKTSSGLVIATGRAEPQLKHGRVVAVGPGQYLTMGGHRPMSVKVGDTVAFPAGNGFDLRDGDKACRVMREEEVLGVTEVAQ